MTSKYDSYWAALTGQIRAAVEQAAIGLPAEVRSAGLADAGQRQSWHGIAEVRGRELIRSSMAHATSLGRMVSASGICDAWPAVTFRLAISAAGDVLSISADQPHSGQPGTGTATAKRPTHRRDPAVTPQPCRNVSTAGTASPRDVSSSIPDRTAADRFYQALGQLADILGGPRFLRDCRGSDGWPPYGVYFFFEPGQTRADGTSRVVRIGTHALTATSQATLWDRLRQHRGHVGGQHAGGGNHRASVFRRHVGAAGIRRDNLPRELLDSWLDRHGPRPGQAEQEQQIEQAVSAHIRAMPFLWLAVPDRADRARVERNSIALTSCLAHGHDKPSTGWLGRHASRREISQSGLWNVEHIRHSPEPGYLDLLSRLVHEQRW